MTSTDFWDDLPPRGAKLTEPPESSERSISDEEEAQPFRAFLRTALRSVRALVVPILILGFMLLGAFGGLMIWGWQTLTATMDGEHVVPVIIEIDQGTSTLDILTELEAEGLLLSKWPALGYILVRGQVLRAGVYTFTPTLTGREIVNRIIDGNVTDYRVTIPEGWRIEQIGELLESMEIVPKTDFLASALYDPVRYTLPEGVTFSPGSTLEGLLFPDTYRFRLGVTSKEIVATMLQNFVDRTDDLRLTYDDVILASLVEREAGQDEERAAIAGVYQNRLESNLRLDADPTVQYARASLLAVADPEITVDWWGPLLVEDYQAVVSAYNTYRVVGLPPTPIANPGLASLHAAKQPEEHNSFYFFHTETGQSIFSKTLEEHNVNRRIHSLEKTE